MSSSSANGPNAASASTPSAVPTKSTEPKTTTALAHPAQAGTALAAVRRLLVKGPAAMTGYSRDRFGPAWADADHNGCDTRDDILRRDLTAVRLDPGTGGCEVLSGTLHDPYTGETIHFVRGVETSEAVQIDHVVALGDAWQMGAQSWTASKREDFANDPLDLLAVDGPENDAKGDADAASWLPPSKAYRCAYVARQVAVKVKYGLAVTSAERASIERVLETCAGQRLPTSKTVLRAVVVGTAAGTSAPTTGSSSSGHPAGATAECRDHTYSYSEHHSGTCSRHGGVLVWI